MSGHTTPSDDSTDEPTTLGDLADEVDQLRERLDQLEARLDAPSTTPETDATDGPSPRDWLDVPADHRDEAVVSALTPGETYSIPDLRDAYRRETDIRASSTLRERVKTLLQSSAFTRIGNNRLWRYTPPGQALDTGATPAEAD